MTTFQQTESEENSPTPQTGIKTFFFLPCSPNLREGSPGLLQQLQFYIIFALFCTYMYCQWVLLLHFILFRCLSFLMKIMFYSSCPLPLLPFCFPSSGWWDRRAGEEMHVTFGEFTACSWVEAISHQDMGDSPPPPSRRGFTAFLCV